MADRRRVIGIIAAAMMLAAGLAACEDSGEGGAEDGAGVLYGVGDDHRLWRWEVGSEEPEAVLDLSGAWKRSGDVGLVLQSSLSIAPDQGHAAWIAGGTANSELLIGDIEAGELTGVVSYPVDHICIDPVWAPDGSALLVHRAEVWGETGTGGPTEAFGPTEWFSPEGRRQGMETAIGDGCRLRWYESDGATEGIYHDLAVTELYRVDESGERFETIALDSLSGIEPQVTGLAAVDPTGRYVCLADGYTEHATYEGGFTVRPQRGTTVIDLSTGKAVGEEDSGCESLTADGYLARAETTARFFGYEGAEMWEAELPPELANSPNLFYFEGA